MICILKYYLHLSRVKYYIQTVIVRAERCLITPSPAGEDCGEVIQDSTI